MTTPAHQEINLKVVILDTDFYASHAINSFLAWDRRTRVTHLADSVKDMWTHLNNTPLAELPNIVLLEADHIGGTEILTKTIHELQKRVAQVRIICMGQDVTVNLVEAAADANAAGYFLKQDVGMQIAWGIVYSLNHEFTITSTISHACSDRFNHRIFKAAVLPGMRKFPELTGRIGQALKLCVLDGLPAHLAADEMGISLHTIRGYIKEGYRILEAHDDLEYATDMTPQERAFMRLTAFDEDDGEDDSSGGKRDDD